MNHYYLEDALVATTPRHLVTQDGMPITSFRIAVKAPIESNRDHTNWFTVTAFRSIAIDLATKVEKGHRISVSGELVVRDWNNGERTGTSVEIVASSFAPDPRFPEKPKHACNCDNCGHTA